MKQFSILESIRFSIRPMTARTDDAGHRAATSLELLFDLVSVIAIAAAASGLHHAIAENHALTGISSFLMAFFSIWWAWMHFTWFATSYDNDDAIYRLAVFVMMTGSLCIAAGISDMFTKQDFTLGIAGYVIMRLAHVGLLLRAANHNPEFRNSNRFYALGIVLVQILWVAGFSLVPPSLVFFFFFTMVALEFSIPALVSRYGTLPWHKGHIAERFGLLTIIVLGESLLAMTIAIQKIAHTNENRLALSILLVGGLASMFAMWWLYFGEKKFRAFEKMTTVYLWSYGHVVIFLTLAAFGAGLAVNVDYYTNHANISQMVANGALTIPAAGFLFGIWLVHERFNHQAFSRKMVWLVLALLILLSTLLPMAIAPIAALLIVAILTRSKD